MAGAPGSPPPTASDILSGPGAPVTVGRTHVSQQPGNVARGKEPVPAAFSSTPGPENSLRSSSDTVTDKDEGWAIEGSRKGQRAQSPVPDRTVTVQLAQPQRGLPEGQSQAASPRADRGDGQGHVTA